MKNKILIITMGGAIDSAPELDLYKNGGSPKNVSVLEKSLIPAAVKELGFAESCEYHHLTAKDSKDITTEDLSNVAKIIKESDYSRFIITHGTDTMPQNSRALNELIKGNQKQIIITGSMAPLSHGRESDGYVNLQKALEKLTKNPEPKEKTRVVMNGKSWKTENLAKNFSTKEFYYSTNDSISL